MKAFEFHQLPIFECMTGTTGLTVGSKFLTGSHVVSQRESKLIGQGITYYEVVGESGGALSYVPRYDILEE